MKVEVKNIHQAIRHTTAISYLSGVDVYDAIDIYEELCKLEDKVHRQATKSCNGDSNEKMDDNISVMAHKKIKELLPAVTSFFINWDPRGYALKIKETEVIELREKGFFIHTDFGGYGILAPEL